MTWVGKSGEMKSVLVGWRGDDAIDFAAECQLDRGLYGVARDAPGANGTLPVLGGVAAAQAPGTDRDSPLRRHRFDLVFRADDGDLGFKRLSQGTSRDLGPDTARVPESYRQLRT
jgi:hypothetical protein